MSTENLFITASRNSYRFESVRGQLTVEQLWSLPMLSKDNFDLNSVAKAANAAARALDEDDFIGSASAAKQAAKLHAENRLELVKYIIDTKKSEAELRAAAADRDSKRQTLLQALANKEDQALQSMSVEELRKQLESL